MPLIYGMLRIWWLSTCTKNILDIAGHEGSSDICPNSNCSKILNRLTFPGLFFPSQTGQVYEVCNERQRDRSCVEVGESLLFPRTFFCLPLIRVIADSEPSFAFVFYLLTHPPFVRLFACGASCHSWITGILELGFSRIMQHLDNYNSSRACGVHTDQETDIIQAVLAVVFMPYTKELSFHFFS